MKPLKISHNKPCPDCNALKETKEYQDGGFIDNCPDCGFSGLRELPQVVIDADYNPEELDHTIDKLIQDAKDW